MTEIIFESAGAPDPNRPKRNLRSAISRGLTGRCPSCGKGSLFSAYLKVQHHCDDCNQELHHHRADDAPPYLTIFIVGHILIPLGLLVETSFRPDLWVHAIIWGPLLIGLSLIFLPLMKGLIVGIQWANYMHGFEPNGDIDLVDQEDWAKN